MCNRLLKLSLVISLLGLQSTAALTQSSTNYKISNKTLDGWLKDKEKLDKIGRPDPNLAINFIEYATAVKAIDYYTAATDMYLWGLTGVDIHKYKKVIENEIARLAPLLSKTKYEAWRKNLKNGESIVLAKIKRFWIESDPNPATALNERLIEHWQRIAYARQNFTRGRTTHYGTDERGLIYVKYGEPDRKRALTLGQNTSEIYYVANTFGIPSTGYGEFRRGLESFLNFPDCEVWAYLTLNENEPVIYLFGKREGTFDFGLRKSLEEFIPRRAFRKGSSMFTFGVIPGAVIQMMYYNSFSSFDLSFAARRNELDQNVDRFKDERAVRALRSRFEISDVNNSARRGVPKAQSDFENFFQPIKLTSSQARFLDIENNPRMVFIAFALQKSDEDLNPTANRAQTRFTLILRDENLAEMNRLTDISAIDFNDLAVFEIPHDNQQNHYTLTVETFEHEAYWDSLNNRLPQGVGKIFFEKMQPLNPDTQQLEVSDLVIGVELPNNINQSHLPFPVIPSQQIWKTEPLKVYLEIYHLQPDKDGARNFVLECRVVKLKKKGKTIERQEQLATSFDFSAAKAISKEDFGISITNLEPGYYELEVEVTDKTSGEKKLRSASFQIIEKGKK